MRDKDELTYRENKEKERATGRFPSFSIIVVFICLLILGLILVPQLSVKLNPSRKYPVVNISFNMWGQSARVIEMEVTSRLEAMLMRINGVQDISSYSSNGQGSITVRLSEHVDPDMARFEMSTVIRQAWPSLPPGVSYPSLYMSGTTEEVNQPFIRYTINAPVSPILIQEYVDNNIKTKLSGLKGVDRVDVSGASRMVYKLKYDFIQLQNYKVSLNDIRSAIQAYLNKEFLGTGKINDEEGHEQWIRIALIAGNRNQPFNPSVIQVKNSDGTIIYLDQLVETSFEEEEASSYFRINGLNSIYLSVTADDAANQLNMSGQVQRLMKELEKSMPSDYELHLSYDAGEYIKAEMDKIYFRSGLTVLILLCFILLIYRNLKYSFLIIFSLVTNISIAAILYYLLKIELQMFSLAGVTISLTLIIDNAIIMSDQIIQRGNKKAFLAILTATITTIGSLVIIFFMDEGIRLNLLDFAWVIIINLVVSLFIALFLVPALIEKLKIGKKKKNTGKKNKMHQRDRLSRILKKIKDKRSLAIFNRVYERIILFMYRKRVWFIVALILAFGLPVFLLPDKIDKKTERGYFTIIETKGLGFWGNLYNKTFGSPFYKETIKPVSDVALGGTMRLFAQKVRTGSYASGERSETSLNVAATLPNGSTRDQMNTLIRKMENYIKQYPEVKQFETTIESGQRASIRILFVKNHQRSSFPHTLKSRLVSKALELGGGSWGVYGLGDGFNNEIKEQAGSSRIKLLGYSYDDLNTLALAMKDSLMQHRRIKEVTIDSKFSWYKSDYMEYVFNLDKERLAQENILPADLFHSLTPMFEKNIHAGDWINESRIEPVQLFSEQISKLDIWNMENYPGRVGDRGYKLTEVATIEKAQVPQDIAKENQEYRLCLQYEYIGSYQQAWNVMERTIQSFNQTAPLGYKAESEAYRYWWDQGGTSQYWLLLLVIGIIFITTSILFNSLKQPLVIVFIIPVSFIGIFLTFYLFDLNFDQGGFAAFILLAGISVNANIYVLNEYNNIRRANIRITPIKAYLKAWNVKIRPIFLTIVSTVLGFIPFMAGEHKEAFWFPLAAGTIGGLILSFFALFLFLPLFMGVGRCRLT
ncbi:efflux RND transporter permease subunit [uncultured Proteiniphilum sp.]|uniref:efflux RND transporter permease subunit n=1 Tax=uncultured Proteiniphilum sp. TaxID=497637 RepID=UPI00263760A9|nr:efflux RND transporter permease subunit [uncultured Proteiniphilum sp.]